MPTGIAGIERPFVDCELMYEARYNIDRGIGARLENADVRRNAERLIAQRIDDNTDFKEPAVELAPAGFSLLVQVGLGEQRIGGRFQSLEELQETVDEAVKESVDENAVRGEAIDLPEWEIYCR